MSWCESIYYLVVRIMRRKFQSVWCLHCEKESVEGKGMMALNDANLKVYVRTGGRPAMHEDSLPSLAGGSTHASMH